MKQARRFLTARWQNLAMLNYEIDPHVLLPRVPAGCELDTWQGRHFVSVVGFEFLDTKVMGFPVPWHRHFPEVNLRFYVRRKASDGWRRGVVFVKELVPRWAIAQVARSLYGEKYHSLPMRKTIDKPTNAGNDKPMSVRYQWRRANVWEGISATFHGSPTVPHEVSEEAFIAEHYWGYATQRDGRTVEYQVEHLRWGVWQANACELNCDVAALYGDGFVDALSHKPASAFVADGSAVAVRRGQKLR